MVNNLWSERQEDFFSVRLRVNPHRPLDRSDIRTSFRLFEIAKSVDFSCSSFQFSEYLNTVRHSFEKTVGGRCYLIEVAKVDDMRWRANILKLPGVPAAMMP